MQISVDESQWGRIESLIEVIKTFIRKEGQWDSFGLSHHVAKVLPFLTWSWQSSWLAPTAQTSQVFRAFSLVHRSVPCTSHRWQFVSTSVDYCPLDL